jgi:hypothetical protein
MIARPKISRNEWELTEISVSKVGNFAPFSCPGDLVVLAGRTTTQPKRFEGRSTLNKSGAGKRRSTNKGRRSLISGRPSRVATVYATAGPLAAPSKTLPE